ncbi:hypothetical protein ACOSQ3_005307 [Xanthoceras sorbifolium]
MKTSKLKSEADRDNLGVSAIQEWIQSDVMGVPGNSTIAADEVISVDLKVAMGALNVWEVGFGAICCGWHGVVGTN